MDLEDVIERLRLLRDQIEEAQGNSATACEELEGARKVVQGAIMDTIRYRKWFIDSAKVA